jgi:hypothetical protein
MQLLAEEVVRGNPSAASNPFYFNQVLLYLPGSQDYNPTQAWVTKVNSAMGAVANDMKTYIDDVRAVGSSQADCHAVCHRIGTMFCYLGIQDALRKQSEPQQQAGAWTGSLVLCTQEKWEKAAGIVKELLSSLEQSGIFRLQDTRTPQGLLSLCYQDLSRLDTIFKRHTLDG